MSSIAGTGGVSSAALDTLCGHLAHVSGNVGANLSRMSCRSRRRLIRGSERTVGGARGAVADMLRRVGSAAAAADNLPSNAHRQVTVIADYRLTVLKLH